MSQQHECLITQLESVQKRINALKSHSPDIQSRLAPSFKKLWNPARNLISVEDISIFDDLYLRFPNFSEVIDFYKLYAIALFELEQPFEAPPVLLQGDPGLGKTYFVSEFAKAINLSFYEISLSTVSANFVISGTNQHWAEASPGFIANSLINSVMANPIILLDEIDKAAGDYRFKAITPFYSLLESHSAKRFKDEALEVELDTSKIIWIGTSNYKEEIPEPIQSRMQIFEIEKPKARDMAKIIQSVYQNIRSQKVYARKLVPNVPADVIHALETCTPREAKQSLEKAMMSAFRYQRSYLVPSDLVIVKTKERRNVGFL